MRSIKEVWDAVDNKRPKRMLKTDWKQSYHGVKTVMFSINYEMAITRDEFDNLEIPSDAKQKYYLKRKIRVSRNGVISDWTRICDLMSGNSSLLTNAERAAVNVASQNKQIMLKSKGVASTNALEISTIDKLNILVNLSDVLYHEHLIELRLGDVAYAFDDQNKLGPNFVADQVKTAKVQNNGACPFRKNGKNSLKIKDMISIIRNGMTLTCIGLSRDDQVEVVWFFNGELALSMLCQFDEELDFAPILFPKNKSTHPFTVAYHIPLFRYEVSVSTEESHRFLCSRIDAISTGVKNTIQYFNEDFSQIPSKTNKTEQRAFNMMRKACVSVGSMIKRYHCDDRFQNE